MNGEILDYLQVIAVLAGVVVFALVGLRFWLPKLTGIGGPVGGPLHVAWRLTLEPRKTLYIVRAGSDYVLLATSDSGVQFLKAMETCSIEDALRELPAKAPLKFDFASLLRQRPRGQRTEGAE